MSKKLNILPAVVSALVFVPMLFVHSCANTTQAPSGGPKDTIPPALISAKPYIGAINVATHGTKFSFGFDEYVKIKNNNNIFLSPPLTKTPKSKISGKKVIVWFEEDLLPETTYSISFTGAIVDNNEGNMFPGFSFVFSTGERIDSMLITGTVQDCNSLAPMKDMTVMLYKDQSDSAIFKHRPDAACKTDDWGFFCLPYIQDTVYRLYAIKDVNNNNLYDPDSELIGFIDTLIRPLTHVADTLPEMMSYDMKDTLGCQARKSEYTINMFRERPSKQFISNQGRFAERHGFVKFMAQDAWIDSLWISGYKSNQIITQFNIMQDSLEIWVNDRKKTPDTLNLWVNYRKTDSLGVLSPELERVKLFQENAPKKKSRKDIKHEDTTCVFKMEAVPEVVEQDGISLTFNFPIIYENFDSIRFVAVNPKQQEEEAKFKVEQDSTNLRRYIIRPELKHMEGYEYMFKVPHKCFRDINGFYSDSTQVKYKLPSDETLSTLILDMQGVDRKIIVELLDKSKKSVKRKYVINSSQSLLFPYLKEGEYAIRVTDDGNENSIVDTGSVLDHRQPEAVRFFKLEDGKDLIKIIASSELTQTINIQELFK